MNTGLYKHHSGGLYRVLHIATLDESITNLSIDLTQSKLCVVYLALQGVGDIKIMPIDEFTKWIMTKHYRGPKFMYLGDIVDMDDEDVNRPIRNDKIDKDQE